jgi:hypothetical protein
LFGNTFVPVQPCLVVAVEFKNKAFDPVSRCPYYVCISALVDHPFIVP